MTGDMVASVLWQRLDAEGHDVCRLIDVDAGWRLEGVAAFVHEAAPCGIAYTVECDRSWHTRAARLSGTYGPDRVAIQIDRTANGDWQLNGVEQVNAAGLVDLDLGFTAATNTIAIRRLNLAVGETSPAPAAYLAFPTARLDRLEQTYARLDESRYRYTAPAYAYDELLTVAATGLVTSYPRLWRAVY